jgi:glycerol-3-phosphate acyltransferase PlsX
MTRVALDLMGGDHAPASVVDGALLVADETPEVEVVLVGPPEVAAELLAARGRSGRLEVVAARQVVEMDEDPARAIRAKRDATVRVCARLVRDGVADAMVSAGSSGAALAAAVFTLGRQRGVTRPPLAAVVPAKAGPLVLLDVGANPEATADLLAQYALAGAAYATVRLGLAQPRVALLTNGTEAGKGDAVRKEAYAALAALPIRFVGNVEGSDVPYGGTADVIVTDGFTGNVLVKGLEGMAAMLTELYPALADVTAPLSPEASGSALLLGVEGVVIVGHGTSSPRAVAGCVAAADEAVREGLVGRVGASLADRLDRRRTEAGLGAAP